MLENARISVGNEDIVEQGPVSKFFDILENAGGLTEEFLYEHQPVTDSVAVVYSTSKTPVGRLDVDVAKQYDKPILSGPMLIVARKGYAGRVYVASDPFIIVHEDAYAITPKKGIRKYYISRMVCWALLPGIPIV